MHTANDGHLPEKKKPSQWHYSQDDKNTKPEKNSKSYKGRTPTHLQRQTLQVNVNPAVSNLKIQKSIQWYTSSSERK